ncbi:hypothetical protein [Algoriphagus resistens]|uniref:hypothetical protein n=1 Tax=Algoriphagus resistens TaxID=1750590 RepID=UPI000716C5B9|nr:hypothetical protein [Algoriphagus resistens]
MKIKIILLSGLLVGTLDILAAFVDYYIATGNGPSGVIRYIASGVFGNEAFSGSNVMLFWGLLFHYGIAYSFTILFFWLYHRMKFIGTNPFTTAVLYGIFMWVITVLIIVPLSNTPAMPLVFWKAVKSVLILILMISLPLVFILKRRTGEKFLV